MRSVFKSDPECVISFNGFQNNDKHFINYLRERNWKGDYITIDECKNTIIPDTKTYSKSVLNTYINQEEGLFSDVPAIVFGDHTRIIKYIDKPCFLGADGVKLLKSKLTNSNYRYLYYVLLNAKMSQKNGKISVKNS